jgi:hypothetical protein
VPYFARLLLVKVNPLLPSTYYNIREKFLKSLLRKTDKQFEMAVYTVKPAWNDRELDFLSIAGRFCFILVFEV